MPYKEVTGILTDIGTEELAHMEMICAIIYQLTKNLSPEEIERSGFAPYYVDHTLALWPQAASGAPWTATYFQSKGDPITDLHEDLAAEQKARTTYDNILRLIKDPCLLYTSDAADEEDRGDLGGRRNIKKKKKNKSRRELGKDNKDTNKD